MILFKFHDNKINALNKNLGNKNAFIFFKMTQNLLFFLLIYIENIYFSLKSQIFYLNFKKSNS